jgi:predicted RNA-binding protein with RPS1 domain
MKFTYPLDSPALLDSGQVDSSEGEGRWTSPNRKGNGTGHLGFMRMDSGVCGRLLSRVWKFCRFASSPSGLCASDQKHIHMRQQEPDIQEVSSEASEECVVGKKFLLPVPALSALEMKASLTRAKREHLAGVFSTGSGDLHGLDLGTLQAVLGLPVTKWRPGAVTAWAVSSTVMLKQDLIELLITETLGESAPKWQEPLTEGQHRTLMAAVQAWRCVFASEWAVPAGTTKRAEEAPSKAVRVHADLQDSYSNGLAVSAWSRVAQEYEDGDDVIGRVVHIAPNYVLVEIAEQVSGIVYLGEISDDYVSDPHDYVNRGDIVIVRVRSLDPQESRAELSLRDGAGRIPRKPVACATGDGLFLEKEWREELYLEKAAAETSERESVAKDLSTIKKENRELRAKLKIASHVRQQAKSEAGLGSMTETEFVGKLQQAWSVQFDGLQQAEFPLAEITVGTDFLSHINAMSLKDAKKLLDVCVDIASGRVWDMRGRRVHPLRGSRAGSARQRVRAADGAKAWRCNLPNSGASGMRVHWWQIPSRSTGCLEFASASTHDDYYLS